jgi:guanylate kinase
MASIPLKSDDSLPPRRGIIFILSAPSGAGKTTIYRAALKAIKNLEFSISLTTRVRRKNEADGIDYSFVSEEEFNRRQSSGELAEWARVFESSYGTPRAPLDTAIASGHDILLDIDIQGAQQIRAKYPRDAVSIFVLPPTLEELAGRLRGRATEDESKIQHRLQKAREEAEAYPEYDYLIVNAEIPKSVAQLETIVNAERLKVSRLRGEFAPWKS